MRLLQTEIYSKRLLRLVEMNNLAYEQLLEKYNNALSDVLDQEIYIRELREDVDLWCGYAKYLEGLLNSRE